MQMEPRLTPLPQKKTLVNIKPDLDDSQEWPKTKQKSLKSANWRKFDMSVKLYPNCNTFYQLQIQFS